MLERLQPLQWGHPEAAALLALLGLAYGLAGWRMIRCLTSLNAAAAGVWLAVGPLYHPAIASLAAAAIGGTLAWAAYRYHRCATAAMTAIIAFAICRAALVPLQLPIAVSVFAALIVAAFTMVMNFTFFPETAAIMTGVQGGWIVSIALRLAWAVRSDMGAPFALEGADSALISLMWLPICAILVAVQWTDLRQSGTASPLATR